MNEIVCICGPTRFMPDLTLAAQRETLAGRIVVRPEIDLRNPDPRLNITDLAATKVALDELHRAKIRRADVVLFVTRNGYMGESTRAELAYALELGKVIRVEQAPAGEVR
ncbi:hypothetical protein [Amycolatopsis thermoflava]|uniref:hypothetical protein n=1 Tax=Amycolatopsis thermoflava TaxID=84480 RepID=UPI00040CA20D|nr:hypothetical protein [Amycolatopsis thermoflava]